MQFTLSQAAKETGVSKSTLSKALSTGRVSAERLPDGSYRIDASELFRVFPRKPVGAVAGTDREQGRTPNSEFASMRLKVQMLEDQLSRERDLRDQEHATSQETVADLRRRLDRAEAQVLALGTKPVEASASTQRSADPPFTTEASASPALPLPRPRGGLLARLLGRR